MPCVQIDVNMTYAESMILLGTLRRELRCLWYAAQNPERRDRDDLRDRREKLYPLVGICSLLCDRLKAAEAAAADPPNVITWRNDQGILHACLLDDPALPPVPGSMPPIPSVPSVPSAPADSRVPNPKEIHA